VEDSSKDQLVVATNAAFEPFEYTLGGSEYYGIDMEIAALLAEYLGKELVIKNMDFDAVCLSVGQGKADIAMSGLTVKRTGKSMLHSRTHIIMLPKNLLSEKTTIHLTTVNRC